ncbi:ParB/RepB/Spo0J family partition protein [Nocardioides alkalitolerans]|uniref:ParB/RepB/Spo0J family partition protein n=1 Tax=Nocardioides alkalitolerans TaxID=281714 RepID=UPI000403DBF4|nr:hypothetical protein [Nocardioides alkalitolerans]
MPTNTAQNSDTTSHDGQDAPTTSGWAEQVGTIVHVAPNVLHLVRNVRDAQPDKGLIDSIREVGVLEPITALVYVGAKIEQNSSDGSDGSDDEALVVRFGHRRTLAAVEAGRDTVPVYLVGTTDNLTGDEEAATGISRVIEQRDENTHRAGLTVADDLAAVGQLAAFGLSANQIAKRARIKRGDVDNALSVTKSARASGAAARWDDMTLDQLAVVAEFETDSDAVTALRAACKTGQFAHVAQRLRDDRARQAARDAVLSPIAESGITVIDAPSWMDGTTKPLSALRLDPHTDPGTLTDPADYASAHGSCPGHVAWAEETYVWVDSEGNELDEDVEVEDDGTEESAAQIAAHVAAWDDAEQVARWDVTYGCTEWHTNGHVRLWGRVTNLDDTGSSDPSGSGLSPTEEDAADAARQRADAAEAEAEAKRAQRRLVIENNKAWDAAQVVRRDWIATHLATRKTPPKGAGAFIGTTICLDRHLFGDVEGNHLAAAWLGASDAPTYGVDTTPVRLAAAASDNRGVVITLIQVLALIEASTGRHTWRQNGENNTAGRYLRALKDWGYTLSDVEEFTISAQTA